MKRTTSDSDLFERKVKQKMGDEDLASAALKLGTRMLPQDPSKLVLSFLASDSLASHAIASKTARSATTRFLVRTPELFYVPIESDLGFHRLALDSCQAIQTIRLIKLPGAADGKFPSSSISF